MAGSAIKTFRAVRKEQKAQKKLQDKAQGKEGKEGKEAQEAQEAQEGKGKGKGDDKAATDGKGGEGKGKAVSGAAGPSEGSCAGVAVAEPTEGGSTADGAEGAEGGEGAAGGDAPAAANEEQTEQAEQRPSTGLAVGAAVVVCGLQGAAQHNGKRGTVVGVDAESGRFVVTLVDDAVTQLRIKADNLLPADDGEGGEGEGEGEGDGRRRGGTGTAGGEAPLPPNEAGAEAQGEAQGESAAMLAMMESMWRVSLLDIESTLRHVCNKVLTDSSSANPSPSPSPALARTRTPTPTPTLTLTLTLARCSPTRVARLACGSSGPRVSSSWVASSRATARPTPSKSPTLPATWRTWGARRSRWWRRHGRPRTPSSKSTAPAPAPTATTQPF